MASRSIIGLFALLAVSLGPRVAQQSPTKVESDPPSGLQSTPDSKAHILFTLRRISDGTLCPVSNRSCEEKDIWWKSFTLFASDGHTLYLTSIPFPSVERCKKQFDLTATGAEKVIRRTVESDSKGDQVGQRALGFFSDRNRGSKLPSGVSQYKLFWTRGTNYWEITGENVDDVLALEEGLKAEGVNAVWGWRAILPLRPD